MTGKLQTIIERLPLDKLERFAKSYEKTEGCWNWTKALTKNGYADFRLGTKHLNDPIDHQDLIQAIDQLVLSRIDSIQQSLDSHTTPEGRDFSPGAISTTR